MGISTVLSTYIAHPLGLTGLALLWGTIFMTTWKGPHTGDDLRIAAGCVLIIIANAALLFSQLLAHDWAGAACTTGWIAFFIILISGGSWRNQRKRIKKLLGAKAKAARAKVVKKLKDARGRIPKPSLRPNPAPVPV